MDYLDKNGYERIKTILDDLDNINSESSDFYHNIINISAKNPSLTELIRFIVEIYDKIDNKNKNSNIILKEAFNILINENIENKKNLNKILEEINILKSELEKVNSSNSYEYNNPVMDTTVIPNGNNGNYEDNEPNDYESYKTQQSTSGSFKLSDLIHQIINQVKNNQMFYITIIILALIVGVIFSPDNIILLLKEIREFVKN